MEGDLSLEQRIGDEVSTDHTLATNVNGHDAEVDHTAVDSAQDGGSPTKGGFRNGWKGPREPKPNKVYIGGLPETTRQEDLQNCFGKLGNVVNIELKLGYGFVEFDDVKAAEDAVAKYNEGFFMGSKIKVEQSHGGGRTSKYNNDPGACFKCGQHGHWARECPTSGGGSGRRYGGSGGYGRQDSLLDRMNSGPKDYAAPPPPRDYGRYDDYRDRDRYPPPPPRDGRYDYGRPPPPPRDARDYRDPRDVRLPPSPPRDYARDYAGPPPPRRDYDDYRRPDARGPPPVPPPARYDARPYYSDPALYPPPPAAGYPPRIPDYPPPRPPVVDPYVPRPYDRRDSGGPLSAPPATGDKYGYPPAPVAGRPRSPPPPARSAPIRDEYDRGPARDYARPPDYRARSPPPPGGATRYPDYPPRDAAAPGYRRRSPSPRTGSYRGYADPKAPGGVPPYPPANGYSEPGYGTAPGGAGPRPPPARESIPPRDRDFRSLPPSDPGYRRP